MGGKKKTPEPGSQIPASKLTELYSKKLAQEILNGKTDIAGELVKLQKAEASASRPAPTPLDKIKPRRRYTVSPEALAARRKNAESSTGPITADGKAASRRNARKHGIYGQTMMMQIGRPCKSTCPKFADCSLVSDGKTQPGKDCLDKEHFAEMLSAIGSAIEGRSDDLNGLMAVELAGMWDVIRICREAVQKDGGLVYDQELDDNGKVLCLKAKINPVLLALPKLAKDFGISLPDWNLTPAAEAKNKTDEKLADSVAGLMSNLRLRVKGGNNAHR